jgi:hypothetical protein
MRIRSPGELFIYCCGSNHPSYKVADYNIPDQKPELMSCTISRGLFDSYIGVFHGVPVSVYHDHEVGAYNTGEMFCMNVVSNICLVKYCSNHHRCFNLHFKAHTALLRVYF